MPHQAGRITSVSATPISVPFTYPEKWAFGTHEGISSIIVELRTDSGQVGVSELPSPGPSLAVLGVILDEVAMQLKGCEFGAINRTVSSCLRAAGWHYFPKLANFVAATVETAMWDLLGKSVDLPVHYFFGGGIGRQVEFMHYVRSGPEDPHALREELKTAVSDGYETFYLKGGLDDERDLAAVAQVRAAVGNRMRLRLDVNEMWTPATAVRMLRKLTPYDLEFVEQPLPADNVTGMAWLRRNSSVPIAADQSAWTAPRILDIIRNEAADVIVTDPHEEGGLLGFKGIIDLAKAAGIPVVYHAFTGSAASLTAALHILGSSENCNLAHQAYPPGMLSADVTRSAVDLHRPRVDVPMKPGIGIELMPEVLGAAADAYTRREYRLFEPNFRAGIVAPH